MKNNKVNIYEADSSQDRPSTVTPITREERHRRELQSSFSGQGLKKKASDSQFYIWRQADYFFRGWLETNGYKFDCSAVFNNCIGYRCLRHGLTYTVYMFARGLLDTADFSEKKLRWLSKNSFSKDSTVLVVYLRSKRIWKDGEVQYSVCWYTGEEKQRIELWKITHVNNRYILVYFPRQEIEDIALKLMYAFNRESLDVYDSIIVERDPSIKSLDFKGYSENCSFYRDLLLLHRQYGNMKYCYCRVDDNDRVYCGLPYLEEVGCIVFSVDIYDNDRIKKIEIYPFNPGQFLGFDYSKSRISDIIPVFFREDPKMYNHVPKLVNVVPLPPVSTERFALKMYFNNGDCRKYVLPIKREDESAENVLFSGYVFSDDIWSAVEFVEHRLTDYDDYPACGQGLLFGNGYSISVLRCYEESKPFSEPIACNDLVYDGNDFSLQRSWIWNIDSIYEDRETGLFKVLERGSAFNYHGVSTYASPDIERLTTLDFDYISDFSENMAVVGMQGYGYGYVDTDISVVIPMQYDAAERFVNGKAKVRKGDEWFFVDRNGKETHLFPSQPDVKYEEVGNFSCGLCRVSTLKLDFMDLAYHSDYSDIAGTWGYVDEIGREVIAPQFIYANDFINGLAIVCKGEWTIDPKWDYEHHKGLYWHEEELWGGIDTEGNEVIPFIFDEIQFFWEDDVFKAHFGGWENGHWGVIDREGNWLAEPIFEDLGHEYHDGLFTFYERDHWDDDPLIGIYDTAKQKVLFEPQFSDVSFMDDGYINVEVYDEKLGRIIEKIIDREGKEKFHSVYSSISTWRKPPYEVVIRGIDRTSCSGLINADGSVLLPCVYPASWGGISYEKKVVIIEENGKKGLHDFDGQEILPAEFHDIYFNSGPALILQKVEENYYKYGLCLCDGTEILPVIYNGISFFQGDKYVCKIDGHCEIFSLEIK